jgi:hypothetical protein
MAQRWSATLRLAMSRFAQVDAMKGSDRARRGTPQRGQRNSQKYCCTGGFTDPLTAPQGFRQPVAIRHGDGQIGMS